MQSATQNSTTAILSRKRKRQDTDPLVLRLTSPSYDPSESEYDPSSDYSANTTLNGVPGPSKILAPVVKVNERPYECTFEGCTKAYTKPARLIEHQRSHTGDRPFVCSTCHKSYLRESHLQAHIRTHLPQSERPFACEHDDCGKRFWTLQHLRVHNELHQGAKPFQCTEASCDAAFSKHHQLRHHICTVHSPEGTKPYRCEHDGCTKSFATNQKLRAHMKTHDDKRYVCTHIVCTLAPGAPATYYPTWSALQHHMRLAHPPTCPRPSCNGKTFASPHGLRAHMKIHAQRDLEAEMHVTADSSDEEGNRPRKRRRGGELGRDWICEVEGCGKDFKSQKALKTHNTVTHLGRRDFVCQESGCGRAFGYKHLLQRHFGKAHAPAPQISSESEADARQDGGNSGTSSDSPDEPHNSIIDFITGNSYVAHSREKMKNANVLQCPHPHLSSLLGGTSTPSVGNSHAGSIASAASCQYVFSRAYDLRRHLRAEHGVEVERENADRWVKKARTQKAASLP